MRLSILTQSRTMRRIDVANHLVVVNIEAECELLEIHTAALIYQYPNHWRVKIQGPFSEAIYARRTIREAYFLAWRELRYQHRHHCTGCFQPEISKRRPELQELARIYVHPNDPCGYCDRGETHVHLD